MDFCQGFKDFHSFVAHYISIRPELKKKLAKEFEVAESTVERWVYGFASPHPLIQLQIKQFILQEMGK